MSGLVSFINAIDSAFPAASTTRSNMASSICLSKRIRSLLAEARHTEDAGKRKELYDEFQQAMTEAMPYTFLAYVDADYAMKANIKGITENTVLGHHGVGVFHNIAEWTIENEQNT